MSTRGIYGVVVDGELKVSYNHSDSYPTGLGAAVASFVKGTPDYDAVVEKARALKLVEEEDESPSGHTWYVELRAQQGDLAATLERGVMTDGRFYGDSSLFTEWGYVVNLDNMTFEVYRGYQTEPHSGGHWDRAERGSGGYYGIKLVEVIPIGELGSILMEDLDARHS